MGQIYRLANFKDYQEARQLAIKKFGEESKAYKIIMKGIDVENATGSQFFFNSLVKNSITFNDLEEMYKIGITKNFYDKGFYTDTKDLILRTSDSFMGDDQFILKNLVEQVKKIGFEFSAKNPLRISGLEFISDSREKNDYGLLLNIGKNTKMINDKRFRFGRNNSIKLNELNIPLSINDEGLSCIRLISDGTISSDIDICPSAHDNGRIIIRGN